VDYAIKWLFVVGPFRKLPPMLYFMGLVLKHPKEVRNTAGNKWSEDRRTRRQQRLQADRWKRVLQRVGTGLRGR
jgi:hypothetical protein